MFSNTGPFDKSIIGRSMVIYENEGDYGADLGDRDSYFLSSNIKAIACCNITEIQTLQDDADDARRKLSDVEAAESYQQLRYDEYRQIFGVDFDPADWTKEAFERD